ncbi:hypothetical protein HHK36_016994 [Tetracentron sinense]|uniref:Uncharacterized protein n=1 Tax=Tetracentron sinense TaxID=13715 RepID=A0A834Z1N0_TETSI|nr:hypothetical protein HHK36_016994 [Tetracentron sinense]
MEQKALPGLLIIFLCFSYVLSSGAVPLSRTIRSINADPLVQEFELQRIMELKYAKEVVLEVKDRFIHGRMDMEDDYPGTGANNHHDPKTPGRS